MQHRGRCSSTAVPKQHAMQLQSTQLDVCANGACNAYWSEQHCGMLLHAVCSKPTVACTVRVYCRARTR